MPTFEVTSPDGRAYHVEGDNAEGALAAVQQMHIQSATSDSLLSPRPTSDANPFEEYRQKPANPFEQYRQNPAHPSDLPPGFVAGPAAGDYSKMSDADLLRVVGANPIRIAAPDGSTVHFPAGTSDDTIKGAMAKAYPPPGKTINIQGRKVAVDDSFFKLSPDEQNSTVDEIAKSLSAAPAGRQVTDPALLAQLNAPTSTAEDVAKSAGIGLVKGGIGLAGMAGDLAEMAKKGADWVGSKLPSVPSPAPDSTLGQVGQFLRDESAKSAKFYHGSGDLPGSYVPPTGAQIQKSVEGVTGDFYQPKTTMGQYAQTAGEFAPALMGGPETLGAKLVSRIAVPAAVSETAGQLTKGTAAEPYARAAGALVSPLATSGLRRAITPLPANAERAALVDTLGNEGVDLTAGQRTGNKPLQWAESTFGDMPGAGGAAARTQENQAQQFTAAALRRAGETADRATPDVIDGAFRRIGSDFEGVAQRNHVVADSHLGNDLATVEAEYNNLVGPTQRAPVVENTMRDLGDIVAQNGGHITGEQYNALTSRLARQARGAKADPQLQEALTGTRGALDDAMERSLQASGNTADLDTLRTARRQYRNLLTVEKAATGAGAATAEGLISPSALRNATVTQNRRMYARGQGDFADLARAGEGVMKPLPNSGTAPRQYMQHMASIIGGVAGGATGGLPGAVAGIAAPAAAGRVLMSRPVQAYLGNRVLGPATENRRVNAVTAALLAHQGSPEPTRPQISPAVLKVVQGMRP
jgi:hypothetical protein